ncbi:MAG: transaldolase, partial [Candidatus Eisenbacteria bacterium]|nr:transaldolase [Candidatus Eisenbacteria bacterium]
PVIRWERSSLAELGAEFARWEIATVAASQVLGVDPFDEPNVSEAKQATATVLDGFLGTGTLAAPAVVATAGDVSAAAPAEVLAALAAHGVAVSDPFAIAAGLATLVGSGDYVAILAYLARTDPRHAALERLRHALRDRTRAATTLGYGPRFLHSTGQLHKGGPSTGVFLQLASLEPALEIPGERYGFRELQIAQAAGDYQVLERRGRRVVRLNLGSDPDGALEMLVRAVSAGSAGVAR